VRVAADGQHARLDFGVRVLDCCADAAGHWVHIDTWTVYGADGVLLWECGVKDLPEEPAMRRCRVTRPYLGGPRKPVPYARRLRDLRLANDPRTRAYEVLTVFAGHGAWERMRRELNATAEAARWRPCVVLPPGDDPYGYDWSALGQWRFTATERQARRAAGLPGDAAWGVVVADWDAPLDAESHEVLATLCLAAGCAYVDVHEGARVVQYRSETAEARESVG
jgi:hypothetical protein